jgi:5-methylthioribose kinase
MDRAQFKRDNPDIFLLDAANAAGIAEYLRGRSLIEAGDVVQSVTPAGDGNMNCTLRVVTTSGSLILKQSRPWVEKYPHIAAPHDRALSEARFYMLTSPHAAVAQRMPKLLELDTDARIVMLEDQGEASDYTSVYTGERIAESVLLELTAWLSALHSIGYDTTVCNSFANQEMRQLNHEHIFRIPLAVDNGLDLDAVTPGLSDCAKQIRGNSDYVQAVTKLGEMYLDSGSCLLHGDFFPGSWLRTNRGVCIIDPEFAFFGRPEFDVGVFLAHLQLSNHADSDVELLKRTYVEPLGFQWGLARQWAGVEIMRRLLGVAQLPLAADLERKRQLLNLSERLVLNHASA